MRVIPAIDLKNGQCVRLREGRMNEVTVYGNDPVEVARRWVQQGARWLHLVDLDGALAGRPKNLAAIQAILAAVADDEVRVQLGGGIRNLDTIERYLDMGVDYVVIGTAAVKNPGLVQDACAAFPGHVVVGIDAREGRVATDGWSKVTGHDAIDLARRFEEYGVEAFIYTDIGRDGMMRGVNVEATVRMARALSSAQVIAAGGVASIADIEALAAVAEEGISGVIVGRALYEGAIDIATAQERANAIVRAKEGEAAGGNTPQGGERG
ncbi:MAG: 1-(5-phosphoribosyl)-5-[(5-phosphoribosylamino)methylideneamino]imidazole-4-carboxamide isomerase [Hydrogenophilus sp.]|nr:1-(5-phosphoribosyl)-5-[(5-phosphoribosylamino)methylideneamino]imidazole-4-carboxamide isomerase [Hydrogenophilus sp.]